MANTVSDGTLHPNYALLSSSKNHMQLKSDAFTTVSKSTELIIKSANTNAMRLNNSNNHYIAINGSAIEEVDTFVLVYLDTAVSKGGTDKEIRRRLGQTE